MRGIWAAAGLAAWALANGAAAAGYHVIESIPGPDGGWDYARVDPAHNRLLVAHGGSVMALDLATRQVTAGLAPGARLHLALPLRGGKEMLVTNGGTDTAVFADALTGATIATVPVGKGPDAGAIDTRSGLVLVVDHAGGDVTLIDPKTHKAVGVVAVGGTLEETAVDGAGRAFVNVEDRNEIAVVDIAARKVAARWPLAGCDGPTGLAYDAADKLLIASCDGATDVVSSVSGKVVATLVTGKGADGVVYDPARRRAFVSAGRDGTLSVIAIEKGAARVVETVPTERGARTLALDERTGRLYLPSAQYAAAPGGGRPTVVPGTFKVLVVGP